MVLHLRHPHGSTKIRVSLPTRAGQTLIFASLLERSYHERPTAPATRFYPSSSPPTNPPFLEVSALVLHASLAQALVMVSMDAFSLVSNASLSIADALNLSHTFKESGHQLAQRL
ncbi:hypothetical protein BDM02DRAFT_3115983 [Thelephora ganbajun]|uniref:Uncharacterized protein n=1 Tax=Thelephora ganbajun TaxID=370292 RepID=A0ACB6ZFX7_THEGA|nr:hypothetical protein BDM02DRAFT_3115983 [Thelephora ganbajun]